MKRFFLILAAVPALAWHTPHEQITRAAFDSLPEWMRSQWSTEARNLERYCWYPDWFHGLAAQREEIRPYVEKPDGELIHNVTWKPEQDLASLEILISAIARHTRAGDAAHAARYAGVLAHFLEDSTCPAHALMPEDPNLNFVRDLLGLPGRRDGSLHATIERSAPPFDLGGRPPVRIAGSVTETAKLLLVRCYASIRGIRATLLDTVRAVESGDTATLNRHRLNAEMEGAKLLADGLYTAFLLAKSGSRLEP